MTFNNPMQAFVDAESATASKPSKQKRAAPQASTRTRETKKSAAIKLYKAHISQGKRAVIDRFKSELAMTDAGANSYFYAIKRDA